MIVEELQRVVTAARGGEAVSKQALQREFESAGFRALPAQVRAIALGRNARAYLWKQSPYGTVALIVGGAVGGGLVYAVEPYSGRGVPNADVVLLDRSGNATHVSPVRRNPATGPSFATLERSVKAARSETAQVNTVVRTLAGMGYPNAKAARPEVHTTSIDRSTYRVYVWRDTPYGDHVVLGTGPSFEPKVALGSDVPSEPGVGVYVRAVLDTKGPRTLAGAGRAASRATPRERPAPKPRASKPKPPAWLSTDVPAGGRRGPSRRDADASEFAPLRRPREAWLSADVQAPSRRGASRRDAETDLYEPTYRPPPPEPKPKRKRTSAPKASAGGAAAEKAELLGGLNALAEKLAAMRGR